MSEITFGRYSPYKTVTHKLDARIKIGSLILLFVAIFLQFNMWTTTLIVSGILLLLLIILMIISKVSILDLFRSLATMWFLVLFLLVIYIFIPNSTYSRPAFNIGNLTIYWDAFYQCGYIILRLIMMVCVTMILTATTKPMDLTRGLEWGMSFLKPIHFPAHEIAMTISIALRFIPTILDETERIMKAQASRGIDFSHGSLVKRFNAVIALIIPLFVSAFQRSEELSNAMEVRGYDPREKRTAYHKLQFHWKDLVAILIVLAIFGGVLTLFIIDKNGNGPLDLVKFFSGKSVGF